MGIKNLNKRLVEVGKIKIGGKNPNKTYNGKDGQKHRAPVKFDHFAITTLEKDNKDNFIIDADIMSELGGKPKALDILLLSDDIDNNFMTSYAMYSGQKCQCRGDGEIATRRYTKDDKGKELASPEYREIKCDTETCPFFQESIVRNKKQPPKCKPSGILSVMLPQTKKIGGVYKFRTTSWNTVINIISSLEAIKLITGGVLFGIPLKMELIEKPTEEHGKVKVVNIIYAGSIQQLQIESGQQKQLRIDGSVSMVKQDSMVKKSGILEDDEPPEDIETEFYPAEETDKPGTDGEDLAQTLAEKPPVNPVTNKKEEKKAETVPAENEKPEPKLDIF